MNNMQGRAFKHRHNEMPTFPPILSVRIRVNLWPIFSITAVLFAFAHSAFAIAGVDTAPSPSAPHEITIVQPQEVRLDNGLRVIVAERADLPLLAAEVVIRTGAEVDPDGRAGAASMTGALLTKGTEKMSAPEIANAIESLGGEIESESHWDY